MILRKTQRGGGKSIKTARILAAAAVAALGGGVAHATLYWDANSALSGAGTWDINNTQNWRTTNTVGAPDAKWNPNDGTVDAQIGGTSGYTVTIGAGLTINANSITFATTTSNDVVTGGTALNLTSATASIVNNTNTSGSARAQVINSPINGTDITIVANASTATINAITTLGSNLTTTTNLFTGNLIIGGDSTGASNTKVNQVVINGTGIMPQGAGQKILYNRNFGQILFTAGSFSGTGNYTGTFNNNFVLNNTGAGTFDSYLGAVNSLTVITLSGVISDSGTLATGGANLTVASGGLGGGQGTLVLTNNATYTGTTNMLLQSTATSTGIVRLGIADALPPGTALNFGNASNAASGTIDMAGFNQRFASIKTSGTGYLGGITNTSGTVSTLRISGSASTSFGVAAGANTASSNIGATTITGVTGLTGSNDNIALLLDSNNTGTLTLTRPAGNSYSGGTTIDKGKLVVTNTSGSGTGSGAVAISAPGTLGGTGSVSGLVTNSGKITPGTSVGTITLSGGLTLNTSSTVDMEFSSTPAHDRINVSGGTLTLPGSGALIDLLDLGSGIHNTTGSGIGANPNYVLFNYAALSGTPSTAFTIVAPPTGGAQFATFGLNNTGSAIELTVSGAGNDVSWRGDGSGNGAWDVAITANWFDNGTLAVSKYSNPDLVTFDDTTTGAGPHTITVDAGGVSPSSVTVKGTHEFTIGGGAIGGVGSISKSGTGKLTLTGSNTFTGGTTITQGTLAITSDAALGTAPGSPAINLTVSKTTNPNTTYMQFEDNMTLNVNRTIKLSQSGGGGGGPELMAAALKTVTINGDITSAAGGTTLLFADSVAGTHTGTINLRGNNTTNVGGGFIAGTNIAIGTVNVIADQNFGGATSGVQMNGSNANALTGTLQFGASFTTSRTFQFGGPATGGGTLDIPTGVSTTINSIITGTTQMTKTGPGTLTVGAVRIIKDIATKTGALTINDGTVAIAFNGVNGPHPPGNTGDNSTSKVNKLTLAGTTDAWTSTLDLVDNDLVIQSDAVNAAADYATAYNQVKMAINGGGGPWTGTGITSSKAAANTDLLYAVGIISNNDAQFGGLGDPLYATFSGQTADANAILIKSTYFGDANLDGTIDITDYGLIDTAFNNQTVDGGWVNGDFDYSGGTIDISDYGLIDGAFGNQMLYMDGYLTPGLAGVSAVPEPASLGLLGIGALSFLGRRRRSR